MSRTKSLALAFLLGAFVTGGATGFAAGRTTGATKKDRSTASREYTLSGTVRELQRDLKLSDEQTDAVDSILKWRRVRYNEIMLPIRPALDSARDSARTLIVQRLDATQQVAFTELLQRMSAPRADSAPAAPKER
jgi:hypothetical protein